MFWKKGKTDGTTIFFCSDLHGSTVCFKKFINSAGYYASKGRPVDILLMGGDMTGKLIVPVIKEGDHYRSYLFGKEHVLSAGAELQEFTKKTEVLGSYAHIFEPDEYEEFKRNDEKQKGLFLRLMLQRLEEWMDFAEQRLKANGIPCYVSPGNDDEEEINSILEACPAIICPDNQVVHLTDDHEMLSLGNANLTPFGCPRDIPEEELADRLERMAAQVGNMEACVFNTHCPPYGSNIDDAPLLDTDLRPQIGVTGVEKVSVGCKAVREAIEKYQPLLGLHGHIHESKGTIEIGRTLCINPGSEYSEGILHGALVTIGKDRVLSHMLVSG
jgi:Icc-related predicted phosphoesterase